MNGNELIKLKRWIDSTNQSIARKEGELNSLSREISEKESNLSLLIQENDNLKESLQIVQTVAKKTQSILEYQTSNIVTKSLESVFDNPYKFGLNFVIKRNKTEAEPYFERGGRKCSIRSAGVGAIDVAAFGLKVSLWNLNRNGRLLILDEIFSHLRGRTQQNRTSSVVWNIAHRLKLQMIVIGDVAFNPRADMEFKVYNEAGVSYVEEG